MTWTLRPWRMSDAGALAALLQDGRVRRMLRDGLPYPYTEADADWWLKMVEGHDGKDGIFRSVSVDGMIVGNISVEQKSDVYGKDAEIGYLLITEKWSQAGEWIRRTITGITWIRSAARWPWAGGI